MSSNNNSWSDLVGKPVDEAIAAIQKENSNLHVVKLAEGAPTTRDFRDNRVRVFYDQNSNVASEPRIG